MLPEVITCLALLYQLSLSYGTPWPQQPQSINDRRSDKNKHIPYCSSYYSSPSVQASRSMTLGTLYRIMPRHMSPVLGSSISSFSRRRACHSHPRHSESGPASAPPPRIRSSNKHIKTGSQPYFPGMKRYDGSALMARPCVDSRSLARTTSHTSFLPIFLIFNRSSMLTLYPSSTMNTTPSVGFWMSGVLLMLKIDLFILQCLKEKLGNSIPRV